MKALIEALVDPKDPTLIFMFDLSSQMLEHRDRMKAEAERILGAALEDVEDPHITILYMGKGHTDEEVQSTADAAKKILKTVPEPMAIPKQVTTFPISPQSEGRTPIIMTFDPLRLEPINVALLRVTAKQNHQNQFPIYAPHMTLGYAARAVSDAEKAKLNRIRVPITFIPNKLVLNHGDQRIARLTVG